MGRNRRQINATAWAPTASRFHTDRIFHVWGRAIDDMHVFPERADKDRFLFTFERHLSSEEFKNEDGRPYRKLSDLVELAGFAVLDNHFHLLLLQKLEAGVLTLMRSVLPSYGRYFNETHGRRAQIFESPYSVRPIEDEADLRYMIAYVHGQHETLGLDYKYTSHRGYLGEVRMEWLNPAPGLAVYGSLGEYRASIADEVAAIHEAKTLRRLREPLPGRRLLRRGRGSHLPALIDP